jgi:hypothetical protein
VALLTLVLAINLLGDGLRDLTPPENRAFWCVYFISLRLTLALVDRASHAVAAKQHDEHQANEGE